MPIVELHDPMFQLVGELRPHHDSLLDSQDEPSPDAQEGAPSPPSEDGLLEALDGQGVLDGPGDRQGNGGAQEDGVVAPGMAVEGENVRRLLVEESQQRISGSLVEERGEAKGVTTAAGREETSESITLWPLGAGFLAVPEGRERGARGRREEGGQERQQRQARRLLGQKDRKTRPDRATRRQQQQQQQQGLGPGPVANSKTEPPALAAGVGDAEVGVAPNWGAAAVVAGEAGENAVDPPSPKGGEEIAAGGPGEWKILPDAEDAGGVSGEAVGQASGAEGEDGVSGDGDETSCDSSFPLATTLLAWASVFAIAAMYRWLPHQPGANKGHGAGLPS